MKKILLALMSIALMAGSVSAQQKLQEVVYLKNGSIIRGIITEQIPEKHLKIQTADGSVFVYTMSEIEKITKEVYTNPQTYSYPTTEVKKAKEMNTNLQTVEGNMYSYPTTEVQKVKKEAYTPQVGYNYTQVAYSPIHMGVDMNALSINWIGGISISKSKPLYAELGFGALYAFGKDGDIKHSLFALNMSSSITYRFEIDDEIKISPYCGINARGNIIGKSKYDGEKLDWFEDYDAKQLNVGITLGTRVEFDTFAIGLGYTFELNEFFIGKKLDYLSISFMF